MPFYDTPAQNAALDALWGAHHGSTMPSSFQVGLLNGDPSEDGVELDPDGGYARITCANSAAVWLDADQGLKSSVILSFPDATDAWSDDVSHWGIYVAGALFDYGPLSTAISVEAAGPGPQLTITRYFDSMTGEDSE